MQSTIIAAFNSVESAENAIHELKTKGFDPKEISIMMKERDEVENVSDTTGAKAASGAISGATTGGLIGGLAGMLVGVGAITIPGIGPFLAAGPLATALGLTGAAAATISGATTGAVAGGLIGTLMSLGLSQEQAATYETTIKQGGIVVAVPAHEGEADLVTTVLENNNASQVQIAKH